MSDPVFTDALHLRDWQQNQVDEFNRDAPYVRHQVGLLLSVAARIRRVSDAHANLLDVGA